MIYTSCYFEPKTKDMETVRISMSLPKNFNTNYVWTSVAPKWNELLGPYKNGQIAEAESTRRYLAMLDAQKEHILSAFSGLRRLSETKDVALLCWCKKGGFCHRRLLARWLQEQTGVTIPEL